MFLENRFYKIIDKDTDGCSGRFTISILPDFDVYEGHFPNNPVCPGVCNIETIKECAMILTRQKLRIKTIKQCRLTAVATPAICPEVKVELTATPSTDDTYTVLATIKDDIRTYMDYKGTMEKSEI